MFSKVKKLALAGVAAVGSAFSAASYAALDVTETGAIVTGINSAETAGTTIGGYVVAAVAALVVIGVVIGVVKKL